MFRDWMQAIHLSQNAHLLQITIVIRNHMPGYILLQRESYFHFEILVSLISIPNFNQLLSYEVMLSLLSG